MTDRKKTKSQLIEEIAEIRRQIAVLQAERRAVENLVQSKDRQRQLIAYEIHDGLAQQLAAAVLQFEAFTSLRAQESVDAEKALEAGFRLLCQSLAEARRFIGGLQSLCFDDSGVAAAIDDLVHKAIAQGGPDIEFQSNLGSARLQPELENAVYRITQESLTNALRHSKSSKVRIAVIQESGHIRLEVHDWGIGFQPQTGENCFGLSSMNERARLLGGYVRIDSTPGQGTRIIAELPLAPPEYSAAAISGLAPDQSDIQTIGRVME